MASIKEVRERIGAGAALLDSRCPGWETRVDLSKLKLVSCQMCVLGQIYGSYDAGKNQLGISYGTDYGFNAVDESWPVLNREWVRFIGRRLLSIAKRAQLVMRRKGLAR